MENICIGERPTLVDVSLYISSSSTDSIVDSTTDVQLTNITDSNILTASNILTLLEDERYTAIVSFSNVGGDFTTDSIATFSKCTSDEYVITCVIIFICRYI